jgi:hypothetical protein
MILAAGACITPIINAPEVARGAGLDTKELTLVIVSPHDERRCAGKPDIKGVGHRWSFWDSGLLLGMGFRLVDLFLQLAGSVIDIGVSVTRRRVGLFQILFHDGLVDSHFKHGRPEIGDGFVERDSIFARGASREFSFRKFFLHVPGSSGCWVPFP